MRKALLYGAKVLIVLFHLANKLSWDLYYGLRNISEQLFTGANLHVKLYNIVILQRDRSEERRVGKECPV